MKRMLKKIINRQTELFHEEKRLMDITEFDSEESYGRNRERIEACRQFYGFLEDLIGECFIKIRNEGV
jgi:hypothetical protein